MPGDVQRVSDALGPLVRWLAHVPDPVHLHLVCPSGPAEVSASRDAAVVRLPCCAAHLPVSVLLELVLAGARTLTVHGTCHHQLSALADARALLAGAGRDSGTDDDGATRRWGRRPRTRSTIALDDLSLPRRAVIAPAIGSRRYGARGRADTERGRLLDTLARLGLDAADLGRVQADRLARTGPMSESVRTPPPAAGEPAPGEIPAPADDATGATRPDAGGGIPGATVGATTPVAGSGTHRPVAESVSAVLTAGGCTACGTCVLTCPEGALALTPRTGADPGTGGDPPATRVLLLTQEPTSCTDCGACTAICPTGALTRIGARDWTRTASSGRIVLATMTTLRCGRCRAEYAPGPDGETSASALCPVCADRRRSPFGSIVPTAAVVATEHSDLRR